MSPPRGSAATQPPHPGHQIREPQEDTSAHLSEKVLVREAYKFTGTVGLEWSRKRVRQLVRVFITEGRTGIAELHAYLLHYADPTGEAAVSNVMKEQR